MTGDQLEQICNHILKGMTEKEACILSDVEYTDYLDRKEKDETIRKLIEKKIVKFKETHLDAIQRTKSDKNSMYLLEKLRPDEFGSKSKNSDGPTVNNIQIILKEIQNDPDNSIIKISNRGEQQVADQDKIQEGVGLLS